MGFKAPELAVGMPQGPPQAVRRCSRLGVGRPSGVINRACLNNNLADMLLCGQTPESTMPGGKIKKVVADKGFGFLEAEDGKDVFFHHSAVANQGFNNLSEGQRVEYTLDQASGGKGKGPRAASVTPS